MSLDTKTKLISIHTLNQVIFDPHTKPSQLWSLHWNQVESDPPHWNHVYFDHPHDNKSFSMPTLKACHFRAVTFACHTYSNTCDTASIRIIVTSANSCYSWRFHITVKPRKYRLSMYHILFLLHGIYTTRCDTGGRTSLRSIPPVRSTSWCHI